VTTSKLDVSTLLNHDMMWTLLGTLYLRAYESRSPRSILRDHYAAEALERIEYDERKLARRLWPKANQFLVALRAKQLDVWALAYLDRHPNATVLQLGCGLDSRVLRLEPPATVRWYDVDLPDVIKVRRQLFDERDGYRMVAASVTDEDWLTEIPHDRPTLIVAEGLLMYLERTDAYALLRRLTDHFTEGELIFDQVRPWAALGNKVFRWGLGDGTEIERANPRLRLVERVPFTTLHPLIHAPGFRRLYQVLHKIPAMRNMLSEYRFTF
jgi:methyltransferase (TIGR00027 family)